MTDFLFGESAKNAFHALSSDLIILYWVFSYLVNS